MTGKELDHHIEQVERKIAELEKSFSELESNLGDKQAQLRTLRLFTEKYTSEASEEIVPANVEVYALKVLKKVLAADHEPRHIDYSPMYQYIAKYNLTISRVCEILGISNNTRNLISNNKLVHMSVLKKIADFLECDINELFVFISEEERIRRLEKFAFYKSVKKGEDTIDTADLLQGIVEGYRVDLTRQATRDMNTIFNRFENGPTAQKIASNIGDEGWAKVRNLLAHEDDPLFYLLLNNLMKTESAESVEGTDEEE